MTALTSKFKLQAQKQDQVRDWADANRCNGWKSCSSYRAHEEFALVKLQVRRVDQTRYPMIVVASLSAVPQSCRTPLQLTLEKTFKGTIQMDPCDSKGYARPPEARTVVKVCAQQRQKDEDMKRRQDGTKV